MERRELSIKDIFKGKSSRSYSSYDMLYKQEDCELHRWPELYQMMEDHDLCFEHNSVWDFVSITQAPYTTKPAPDFKELVMLLFKCFHSNHKIALSGFEGGCIKTLELRSFAFWVDEPFEAMRNRKLFDLRNYLGLSHGGYGKDSIRIWSDRFPHPINYEI